METKGGEASAETMIELWLPLEGGQRACALCEERALGGPPKYTFTQAYCCVRAALTQHPKNLKASVCIFCLLFPAGDF